MPNESLYYLPFDVSQNPIHISQGRNGPWSHFLHSREIPAHPGKFIQTDLTDAVDFALPFGTPVRASRDGEVNLASFHSCWFYEGSDPTIGNNQLSGHTNFVLINHEDGTSSLYSHLKLEQLVFREQQVRQGEVIGYTGRSGWIASIPHLHFQVRSSGYSKSTLPVLFADYDGPLEHEKLAQMGLLHKG